MTDFVIAVRTYDRNQIFLDRTYTMLTKQSGIDVKEQLYIFVADEEQKQLYEETLGDRPYAKIVVGKKGGKEAIDAITNYFDEGQMIFFLDDDFKFFYEWETDPVTSKVIKHSTNLKRYVDDAMVTMQEENVHAATFGFTTNGYFLQNKPWKEIRPIHLVGGAFLMRNDRELIQTTFSQCDDLERTCKFFEKYGAPIVYHWTGFDSQYGKTEGGMQSSGDRGDQTSKMEITKSICETLWNNSPVVRKYANPVRLDTNVNLYIIQIKNLSQLKKLVDYSPKKWPTYFGEKEISVERNILW